MNRLKCTEEAYSALENCIVKSVGIYNVNDRTRSVEKGLRIKTKDGKTHRIHHIRTCCEFVKVELPENIHDLYNRKILTIHVSMADNDINPHMYEHLAQIKITDSLGGEYNIEFIAKSTGCSYSPYITAQREWVVCVFN